MATRSAFIPRADADRLLRREDQRRMNRVSRICPIVGLLLAEISIIPALASDQTAGINPWQIVGWAAVVGLVFGVVAATYLPVGLCRKPYWTSLGLVFASTAIAEVAMFMMFGAFPLFVAGVVSSAATLIVALAMPNEPIEWGDRCVACGYDLSDSGVYQCPECGVTAIDVRTASYSRQFERCTRRTWVWLASVVALWVVASTALMAMGAGP